MKTIIAPIDFSASSDNAALYAADLALAIHGRLMLLNVVQVPMAASEIPMPDYYFEEELELSTQDIDDLAARLAIRTKGKLDITVKVTIGTVSGQIKEVSEEIKPFAIVMGIKENKSLDRILLGSESLHAINCYTSPVLIIPENIQFNGIHKIGLACDLRDVNETIPFDLLQEWISVFNPELHIIHLSKLDHDLKSPNISEAISLQNHLNKLKPAFHFLTGENLGDRLNDYILEQKLDLLIVIPKHHGLLGLFDKKFSKRIIAHGHTAMLSVHL